MYRYLTLSVGIVSLLLLSCRMGASTIDAATNSGHSELASTSSVLVVNPDATLKNIARIGVNLGTWTTYGSEQYSSNIVMNPGFEPLIDRAIVIVQDSDSSGFSDNAAWLARADGFWNKATFQVLTGKSAGTAGTIVTSLAKGRDGLPWFTTSSSAPKLAKGDAISVTQRQTEGVPWNWWLPATSTGHVAINTTDHRPDSPGSSVAELTLQPNQSTEIDFYWDSETSKIPRERFLPVDGRWHLSFWARGTSGSASLFVIFQRLNGSQAWVNQTLTLTSQWQQYTMNFDATDTGPAGPLGLKFVASGQSGNAVRLDDVQLGRSSDFPGAWREELVGALTAMRPGYLRDTQGQLGDTLANRIGDAFARGPTRYVPDPSNVSMSYLYGLTDFLSLCHEVGAQPWIVLPTTLYDSELTGLGQYLAHQQSTYNFSEIVLEWGNENWNPMFRGASILEPGVMGQAANRAFGLIRESAGSTLPLHLVVNGQFVNPWMGSTALANAPLANATDIAPYFFETLNSSDTTEAALSSLMSMNDERPLIAKLQRSTTPSHKDIDVYEVNLSTISGDAPDSQRDPLVAGMVSGTALANRIITAMNAGVRRQNVFALAQYQVKTPVGQTKLWGIVRDLAAKHDFRPTGLAVEMINHAIEGDYHSVTAEGADASTLNAAAFLSNGRWSMVIVSASPTPTSLSIKFPPGGTPPSRSLTLSAPSITSTNESVDDQVKIISADVSQSQITVPAYGLVVMLSSSSS
jgi:hypothetical protein